jgi:hypothetical protein
MPRIFESTVSAICYELARSQDCGVAAIDRAPYNDVAAFVLAQWNRMPRFLAWPLRFATIVFAATGILSGGGLFHRLPPNRRGVLVDSWRNSFLGPCRDLIRFYQSLTILAFYSRREPCDE